MIELTINDQELRSLNSGVTGHDSMLTRSCRNSRVPEYNNKTYLGPLGTEEMERNDSLRSQTSQDDSYLGSLDIHDLDNE